MHYKANWEKITELTYRMKTPGGWLVFDQSDTHEAIALCYVPDPGHDWKFPPKEELEDEQA